MNSTNISITLYNGAKDNKGNDVTIDKIIQTISGPSVRPFISNIRRCVKVVIDSKKALETETDPEKQAELKTTIKQNQETADNLKRGLPAVTWSGTFTKRAKTEIKAYSGLICIDIDKLPSSAALSELKAFLKEDPYTWLIFTSPSGTGLKVVVKATYGSQDIHLKNFLALEHYYQEKYQISIDPSGKDISRLCFLSADTDFRCNPKSKEFDFGHNPVPGAIEKPVRYLANEMDEMGEPDLKSYAGENPETAPVIKPLTKKEERYFTDAADSLAWVKEFTDKKLSYTDGSRNNYIFLFACNANRKGFAETETHNFLLSFAADLPTKEIEDTVKKAYRYNVAEHAKYKRTNNANTNGKANNAAKSSMPISNGMGGSIGNSQTTSNNQLPGISADANDFPVFWKEHKYEKGKGEHKKTFSRLELWRVAFMKFLNQQGFFIIETGREGYQICQRREGIIRTVDPRKIKNHIYKWCQDNAYVDVEEMLRKGQKNYFAYSDLESLPVFIPDFFRDTKDEAFFFFQNCYVKITADSITTHQVSEVQQAIWDTSIIKRDFTLSPIPLPQNESGYFDIEKVDSDIVKFIMQVATNPDKYKDVDAAIVVERFQSIASSIGYMLHGYKSPIGKAVLAVDHKIPGDKTEQNGGSGKSIVGKSFKYLKGVSEIDGRDFDEKYPFRFESIDIDTKVVVMADCKYNLDFGSFFNPITSDFRYNRRHTGYITLPYEDSPKWWFDTNFVFKGEGASYRRRQHIIEFDDFYHDGYNPLDYFGHLLFNDWKDEQWNMFYNFYFQCVQLFLEKGLLTFSQSNYDSRKLMVESNSEFIDWLDGTDTNGKYKIERNKWLSKKDLLKLWNDEAKSLNMTTISPHSFSKWVKKYCTSKGFVFHSKKSNSVEYYMIAAKDFKAESVVITQELFSEPIGGGIDFSKHTKH